MTVLVDTGVLCADHDTTASRHKAASTALESVYDGRFGQPYVSEYVYDEAVTLTYKRRSSIAAAKRLGERIRGIDSYPKAYELLYVSKSLFSDAIAIFERYDDQELSFTDAILVAQYRDHSIDALLSFDDDFDGLVDRLDPAEL